MSGLLLRAAMCMPMYLFEHHLACDLVQFILCSNRHYHQRKWLKTSRQKPREKNLRKMREKIQDMFPYHRKPRSKSAFKFDHIANSKKSTSSKNHRCKKSPCYQATGLPPILGPVAWSSKFWAFPSQKKYPGISIIGVTVIMETPKTIFHSV